MIQLLISSSILILIILLFRQVFRAKVSQRLIYSLWLLAALRLLLPIEIGQSNFSLAAVTKPAAQQLQQAVTRPVMGPDANVIYLQLLQEYMAGQPQPEASVPVAPEVQTQLRQEASEKSAPSVDRILRILWLSGMGLMGLWFFATNLVFSRKARKGSTPWELDSKIPVRCCPHIPSPCLLGFVRPVICIPPDESRSEAALSHVLAHETAHYRHWDPLWSLVRCLCLCIYWFNPLVWVAALLSKQDCELACDEAALERLGDGARISYGKTLMSTVSYARSAAHIMNVATSMGASKKQLKQRLCLIVKKPKTILTAAVACLLVSVLVAGCAFIGDSPAAGAASVPNDTPSTQPPSSSVTQPDAYEPAPSAPVMEDYYNEQLAKDMLAAADLVERYVTFCNYRICCDFAYIQEDMSAFVHDSQLTVQGEPYCGQQIKISCCHTIEQVRAHVAQTLGEATAAEIPLEDILFTDGEGNLYVPVTPMGSIGYSSVRFRQAGQNYMIVYADSYDIYKINITAFKLEYADGHWYIADVYKLPPLEERLPEGWIN